VKKRKSWGVAGAVLDKSWHLSKGGFPRSCGKAFTSAAE